MSKHGTERRVVAGAKWNGSAEVIGVPSRDLTAKEYKEYKSQIDECEAASQITIFEIVYDQATAEEE